MYVGGLNEPHDNNATHAPRCNIAVLLLLVVGGGMDCLFTRSNLHHRRSYYATAQHAHFVVVVKGERILVAAASC
jgi:hypothetical protein